MPEEDISWEDTLDKRAVRMVSENLAREAWGSAAAAIGKRIRQSTATPWREVIGVAADEREDGVNVKAPAIAYWPILMKDFAGTRGFLDQVQRAVWSVSPELPLAQVQTLERIYEKSLARTSFTLVMLALAGAMAMLIGLVGIYGVISYSVSQRAREIGIRMALGAQKQEVRKMFVLDGLLVAAIGIVCGLAGAIALTRSMSSLLFEVSPVDPATYAGASALLASAIPAWRATAMALRAE